MFYFKTISEEEKRELEAKTLNCHGAWIQFYAGEDTARAFKQVGDCYLLKIYIEIPEGEFVPEIWKLKCDRFPYGIVREIKFLSSTS